jgi:hypothetical protein
MGGVIYLQNRHDETKPCFPFLTAGNTIIYFLDIPKTQFYLEVDLILFLIFTKNVSFENKR